MSEPSIDDLITGPLSPGESIDLGNIEINHVLDRFDTVDLTTPFYALPPRRAEFIEQVREELRTAQTPMSSRGPLSNHARVAELIIQKQLDLYIEPGHLRSDRLYILEFQGPWQYLMFGHTTNLSVRVTEHQRAAAPHGFALVNGWASPWIDKAQHLEQEALFYGGVIHHPHYRERFFDMPFELGLKLVRLVYEKGSDWRTRFDSIAPEG